METKESKNARNRKYYERNKEKIKEKSKLKKQEKSEYHKKYYEKNIDIINEKNKEYYLNNNEELKKKSINYYNLNKEYYKTKNKEYRQNNKESIKKRQKLWYDNNLDKVRNNKYQKTYGITLEEYNEIFQQQEGKCKICGIHQDELRYNLVIDHCHVSNRIRGLLCSNCNTLLGFVKEDINILKNAIDYLNDL